MFFLEVDEPLPYIGRPNPRRSLWVHESHAKELDALPESHPSKAQLIPKESR